MNDLYFVIELPKFRITYIMLELDQYTPIQLYFILNDKAPDVMDAFTIIFVDLLSRNIIHVIYQNINGQMLPHSVVAGPKYNHYTPEKHEELLLSPFKKNRSLTILISHFLQMSIQYLSPKRQIYLPVLKSKKLSDLFNYKLLSVIINSPIRTREGKRLKDRLSNELLFLQNDVRKSFDQKLMNVSEILKKLRGKYFYFNRIGDESFYARLSQEDMNQSKTKDYDDHYGFNFNFYKYIMQSSHKGLISMEQHIKEFRRVYYGEVDFTD